MSEQAIIAALQTLETTVRAQGMAVQQSMKNHTTAYEARTQQLASLNRLLVSLTDGGKTIPLYVISHGEELGMDGMDLAEASAKGQGVQPASQPEDSEKKEGKKNGGE